MARLLISALLISISSSLMAQSEYEAWLEQNSPDLAAEKQAFQNYMDENDKAFVGFLKQQWKKVELEKPKELNPTPKPLDIPKAKPAKQPEQDTAKPKAEQVKQSIAKLKPIVQPTKQAKPNQEKPKPPVAKPQKSALQINVIFLGHDLLMPKLSARDWRFTQRLNSKNIAKHWQSMASQKHQHIIDTLETHSINFKLNDWAQALLVNRYAKKIGLDDQNSQQLFTWFILLKAGFQTRLAYNQHAFVLMPSQQAVYGITYFTLKSKRYYALSFDGEKVNTGQAYTYSGKHNAGEKTLDFGGASNIVMAGNKQQRELKFKFGKTTHNIKLSYALGQVEFSNSLPQLDFQYYPQQGLPVETSASLLTQLQTIIKNKTEVEAVNILLRFMQTAFAYQTDGQQFNSENYLLPIETLHYPYSDCEDKAAMFAWLVESLLGLDAVLLHYPGHIAAAVEFSRLPKGDSLSFKGKRYTMADPTYNYASIGMTMPQFKNLQPKVLAF